MPLSYEEQQDAIQTALRSSALGPAALPIETHPDRVIVRTNADDPDAEGQYVSVPYTIDDAGVASLGAPTAELLSDDIQLMYSLPGASGSNAAGKAPPPFVQKMPLAKQHQWVDVWNSAFKRCKATGGTDAACEVSAFKQANGVVSLEEPPPANVLPAEVTPADWYEQADASNAVAYRLADNPRGPLPAWQLVHVIGKWVVPHGASGPVRFTRAMGDSFIRNFKANVLGRRVPMDERHHTEQNGVALAWAEDLRWGKEGEGLPGAPEPSGDGPILYGRWDYNQLGTQRLSDRNYLYFSPQYSLNYQDKKTGTYYGPTLLAVGGTNDPFIRGQRAADGSHPPMPWVDPTQIAAHDLVILTDGLRPYQEHAMPNDPTPTTPPATPPQPPLPPQAPPVTVPGPTPVPGPGQVPPPQPNVALDDRVSQLERQVAAESAARQAAEAQLRKERRDLYLAETERFVDGQIRRGVPPGSLAKFHKIMKRLDPAAGAVISLSDDDTAAPDLSLADAIREAVADILPVDLGVHTAPVDIRPGDAKLADQVYAAEEAYGKQLAAARAAQSRNGRAAPPIAPVSS